MNLSPGSAAERAPEAVDQSGGDEHEQQQNPERRRADHPQDEHDDGGDGRGARGQGEAVGALLALAAGQAVAHAGSFPAAIRRRSMVSSKTFASTPCSMATSRSGRPDSAAALTISVPLS